MELVRQRNVATYIVFPIVDADGDLVSGAADLDSEIDTWSDGSAPDGFVDCANEAVEIGSTGMYYLSLSQSEMNNDYVVIQVKTSTAGAKTQVILIRTMVGDPLNIASTDDGGAINVTSGIVESNVKQLDGNSIQQASGYIKVSEGAGTGQLDLTSGRPGIDWAKVSNPTSTVGLSNTTVGTVTTNTDMRGTDSALLASSAPANFSDLTITASTGKVTVGTNDDKTGYELADGAITAVKIATDAITADKIATDAIGASELAADAVDEIAADILVTPAQKIVTDASGYVTANLNGDLTATMKASVNMEVDNALDTAIPGTPTADSINERIKAVDDKLPANYIMGSSDQTDKDDEIDGIKAVTDNLPNSGALTDIDTGVNNIEAKLPSKSYLAGTANGDGDIQMDEATGNYSGTVGGVNGNVTGSVGSVTGNVGGNVTGTIGGLTQAALADMFDTDSGTTYSSAVSGSVVKEIADNAGGSSLSEAGIADAVWDELASGHTNSGSFGDKLQNKIPSASVNDYKADVSNLDVAVSTRSSHSAADAADAVWDEASTGHTDAGKAGAQLWSDIDAVLTDTNELQTLISDSKMAAQVKGVDANTLTASAFATDGINEIRDAILNAIVDNSMDVKKCLKVILAVLAGDITNVNNTYIYKDQSDTTIVTEVVSESSVERAIA